jgi:adenosylcobinamide-GDP ribazoletransferase
MRERLAAPVVAFSFLTVLPLRVDAAAGSFSRAVAWFPVVGLAVGAAVAVIDRSLSLVLPASIVAGLDLAALALLTGGLQLDGLADTADGLFLVGDRDRRLAAMRDPGIGAFGVAALVLVLIVEYAALASLDPAGRASALIVGGVIARWAIVGALGAFPYARAAGAGIAFKTGLRWSDVVIASLVAAAVIVVAGESALAALIASALVALGLWEWARRLLGGLTGDVYGATAELAFAATVIVWAAR